MITKSVLVFGAGVFALSFATVTATAAELFALKSMTFADGKMMPKKVANSQANAPTNANCVGDNVSRNCPGATCRTAPEASLF